MVLTLESFICYCRKSSFAIKLPCVYANFAQKGRNTRLRTVYWTLEFVLFCMNNYKDEFRRRLNEDYRNCHS